MKQVTNKKMVKGKIAATHTFHPVFRASKSRKITAIGVLAAGGLDTIPA